MPATFSPVILRLPLDGEPVQPWFRLPIDGDVDFCSMSEDARHMACATGSAADVWISDPLEEMLARFETIALADPDAALDYVPIDITRSLARLWLKLTPRD